MFESRKKFRTLMYSLNKLTRISVIPVLINRKLRYIPVCTFLYRWKPNSSLYILWMYCMLYVHYRYNTMNNFCPSLYTQSMVLYLSFYGKSSFCRLVHFVWNCNVFYAFFRIMVVRSQGRADISKKNILHSPKGVIT